MYPEVSMNVVRRRVLVAGARFAGLSPVAAGTAVARGFAGSSEVALVPFAAGGSDLGVALAHLGDGVVERGAGGWTAVGPGWLAAGLDDAVAGARFDPEAGSAGIGRHLARALSGGQRVAEVMVDLTGVDVNTLLGALHAVLARTEVRESALSVAQPRTLTIEDQLRRLRARLGRGRAFLFSDVLVNPHDRTEIAVTLLALLELIKRREAQASQSYLFGPIEVAAAEPEAAAPAE